MLEDADRAGRSAADGFLDPVAVVEVHARLARALMDLGRYDEAGAVFALLADAVPRLPRGPHAMTTRSALTSTRLVEAQAEPARAPALPATRLAERRPSTVGQGERAPLEPAAADAPPPAPPTARPAATPADLAEAVRQVARLAAAGPDALSARLPVEDEQGPGAGAGSGSGSGASPRGPRRGAPPTSG